MRSDGDFVVYWMIASRRARWSFALDRAIAWAQELGKPLVVLEPLRLGYPYASDRFHRFVIEGMRDNAEAFASSPVRYVPFVERTPGAGKGLLEAIAERACVIVTDDTPIPFLRRMTNAAAEKVSVLLEAIDGNGLLPLRLSAKPYLTAYAMRRTLQKELPTHLSRAPMANPLHDLELPAAPLPRSITERWAPVSAEELADPSELIASLPIDHSIAPIEAVGGATAGAARLAAFVRDDLDYYLERSHPDADRASRLSGYLHFGHVGAHQVLASVARHTGWTPARVAKTASGSKEGWWNASEAADAFLDELVTWREVGHVRANLTDDCMEWRGLPAWARATLEEHAKDPRPELYTIEQLARAETGDDLWNSAQRQLLAEGRIQNYLRMLWGKRVLAWTKTPQEAFEILLELNDRYSIDGRDPNSWMNVGWIFGAYDRPWAPARPIYGSVRYMTSDSARRKLRLKKWLARWSGSGGQTELL